MRLFILGAMSVTFASYPTCAQVQVVPEADNVTDRATWVTLDDYPYSALIGAHEGDTRFRAEVGRDGSVTSRRVVESSGWLDLDEATCRNVTIRAKFKPVTYDSPRYVQSRIKWRCPFPTEFDVNAPYFGIFLSDGRQGSKVIHVLDGPAREQGFQVDDRIIAINGNAVKDLSSLASAVRKVPIGETITIKLSRGDLMIDKIIKAAPYPNFNYPGYTLNKNDMWNFWSSKHKGVAF